MQMTGEVDIIIGFWLIDRGSPSQVLSSDWSFHGALQHVLKLCSLHTSAPVVTFRSRLSALELLVACCELLALTVPTVLRYDVCLWLD